VCPRRCFLDGNGDTRDNPNAGIRNSGLNVFRTCGQQRGSRQHSNGLLLVPSVSGSICRTETGKLNALRHVLLIDDNPLQLKVRETVLRQAGIQVSVATTAESALATLRALPGQIGLIITDHLMPGCNGSELMRQIRTFNTWIPVIVLSGLPEAEAEYHGLEVSFRIKPFPPGELIELVREKLAECDGERRGAA